MYRSIQKYSTVILATAVLAACGGGGGGGGGDYGGGGGGGGGYGNNPPTITNSTSMYSVLENQTGAFLVTATDPDGDTITFSITSGADASLFSVNTSGSVTFDTAPDFEIPSDANSDNTYELTITASDGTASDSQSFSVTVTNDTSDDPVTSNYDGILIIDGYIQSAEVCIPITNSNDKETCNGATYITTTASDGSFSLEIDEGVTGKIIAQDGFNPVISNNPVGRTMIINDPTVDKNSKRPVTA